MAEQRSAVDRAVAWRSVGDGVDSYVVRDGLIQAQTIHDTPTPAG
jgi:hypothetical protein